ncbi:MAG: hypothetical protein [Enterobacter phage ENC19]|nr:MAG: hypothetical protein [Enterobacter phage ENC19]
MSENVKIRKIHQAWLCTEKQMLRYGCVFGFVDNDPLQDIATSPVVEYAIPANKSFVEVVTRSGTTYHIVNPDKDFIKDILKYMDDK